MIVSLGWIVSILIAGLGILGAIINEHYKNHRTRVTVAGVFHAEISTLSAITMDLNVVESYRMLAERLEAGEQFVFPKSYAPEPQFGLVFEKHVDRIGYLGARSAEDIIKFYHLLFAIRVILRNLINGAWEDHPNSNLIKAAQIRTGLRFWEECLQLNVTLLPALRKTASEQFAWLGI